ncbi:Pectin lyase-like superfamily protein [Prunus dulcis]|uniref:Pectin lyase-like superfamily protein n=1 Tax=Prunus dulcis TaxID=3755 RepID=A0A4Y1QL60_PRUDU|nr:Pectin lyase-like superfamily protein [Prunus dulcis]
MNLCPLYPNNPEVLLNDMRCPSELLSFGEFSDCMDFSIGSEAPLLHVLNPAFDYVPPELTQETGGRIKIKLANSKNFHMNVFGCKNVTFQHVNITAPRESVNTDGIHIGRSTAINITDANIGTGDDTVSIGHGSKEITVTKVTRGPGHGISIGSLGKYLNEEPVVGIRVNNCTLRNTQNGLRQDMACFSSASTASAIHFEDIIMDIKITFIEIVYHDEVSYFENVAAMEELRLKGLVEERVKGL